MLTWPHCKAVGVADEGDDQFGAEGGAAPPAPLGTTQLLDSVLHVSLHDFCHKFLADEVRANGFR